MIPMMSATQKKILLTFHLLFSAIMFGLAVTFLILSIVAANTEDDGVLQFCYYSLNVLSKSSVRASTIGTLVTGVLLSVWTQWGLFKFYWIIAKEILMILSILLGPIGMYFWTLKAFQLSSSEGLNAVNNPVFIVNETQLRIGIVLQVLSLAAIFAISVFKPWGPRKKERRLNHES